MNPTSTIRIIVERHPDGFVAYPLGLKGVVVGQGDTFDEAVADVSSAIRFHIETFGADAFDAESPVLEAFFDRGPGGVMPKFPVDAPKLRVIRALETLDFCVIREREHIAMSRRNPDGTSAPLTLPNHAIIKSSTLRTICTQSGISRSAFLEAYDQA